MQIERPNHVWCADISFVPVRNGFFYLVAIIDWAKREVLSWRLSNTMHADFCVDALNETIAKYRLPEIMNTDQGSQFTGSAWITTLTDADVRISMDGRAASLLPIPSTWHARRTRLYRSTAYISPFASGARCGILLRDGQIIRPFPLSILSPGFTAAKADLQSRAARSVLFREGSSGERTFAAIACTGHHERTSRHSVAKPLFLRLKTMAANAGRPSVKLGS
jgi:hypothetical protein